jgi:RecB family exonuclease
LAQRGQAIRANQLSELNFGQQGVMVGKARLTGRLDILEIAKTKAKVIDYKTGKDLHSWDPRGKTAYERIKLHQYRQQLLFYKLLVEGSRSWGDKGIKLESAELVFVEPNSDGAITVLDLNLDELERLKKLITVVWQKIMALDFPDISQFDKTEKGITEFEDWLIENP